jgi:spermidine export protein MdtI
MVFLMLAIATEVAGLTVMKAASASGAYAIWEGSGVALITLVSVLVFDHVLTGREMLGLSMAVVGILLGATGIFGTAICGRLFLGQKRKPIGWVGLSLVFGAVLVLHTA